MRHRNEVTYYEIIFEKCVLGKHNEHIFIINFFVILFDFFLFTNEFLIYLNGISAIYTSLYCIVIVSSKNCDVRSFMWGKIIFFIDVYLVFLKKHKIQKIGGID